MNMKPRDKLVLVLVFGIFIRLLIAPYLTSGAHDRFQETVSWIFIYGFNPMSWISSMGTSGYFFTSLAYVPSLFLNSLGFGSVAGQQYIEWFLMKLPLIAGDVLAFYSLCNIAGLISNDENIGVHAGAFYFLNPYLIRQTTIATGDWGLMMGFVLLSMLNLLRSKIVRSAIYLSVAIVFHHILIILAPLFLAYLLASSSFMSKAKLFFGSFSTSLAFLYVPLLFVLIPLLLQGQQAFWTLIFGYQGILDPSLVNPVDWLKGAELNFTGILATLDLWSNFRVFLNFQVFLVVYLALFIVFLRRKIITSFQLLNRSIILVFSLLLLFLPLVQYPFLLWILPFILLEAEVFKGIPRFYPHVLWLSNFAVSTVLTGQFLIYSQFTFPQFTLPINEYYWPLRRGFGATLLPLSISAVHASFLILIVIFCIALIFGIVRLRRQTFILGWENWSLPLFFSTYCLLEISRITYGYDDIAVPSLLPVMVLFTILAGFTWKHRLKILSCDGIFNTPISKVAASLYLIALTAITVISLGLNMGVSLFLPVQILLFGVLWRINRKYTSALNLQRLSMIFTMIYVFLILLITKSFLLELTMLPFLLLWLYLQFTVECEFKLKKWRIDVKFKRWRLKFKLKKWSRTG